MASLILLTSFLLAASPATAPRFEDVTETVGINSLRPVGGMPPATGGSAWFDWDQDGFVDLLLTGDYEPLVLYRNQGPPDWHFEDVTQSSGLSDITEALTVDVLDIDGSTVLAIVRMEEFGNRLHLWQQSSPGGVFEPVDVGWPGGQGLYPTHGDVDADGDTDLVVSMNVRCGPTPTARQSVWWIENDDGYFRARVDDVWPVPGCSGVPLVTSYDGDQSLALLVTNDFGSLLTPTLVVRPSGIDDTLPRVYGMGIAVGDVNGDLRSDYLFTSAKDDALWVSSTSGWSQQAQQYGMTTGWGSEGVRFKWGAAFLDATNDGQLELYVTAGWLGAADDLYNSTLQKSSLIQGGVDVAAAAGVSTETLDRTVAVADYDQDGRVDMLVGALESWYLFRNVSETTDHWIQLSLPNEPGTTAHFTCGDTTTQREWNGSAAGSFSEPVMHVGLGDCVGPVSVRVLWPWMGETVLSDLAVDTRHSVALPPRVRVEPQTVLLGNSFTISVYGYPNQDVRYEGQPMTWSEDHWTTTLVAEGPTGEHRVVVTADGVSIPLQPRLQMITQPIPRILVDPTPLHVGQPAFITVIAPENEAVTTALEGANSQGPIVQKQGNRWEQPIMVTDTLVSISVFLDGEASGPPLTMAALAAVDSERSALHVELRDDGSLNILVSLFDAVDLPAIFDPSALVLLRDGTAQPAVSFEQSGMSDYMTTIEPGGVIGVEVEGTVLAQSTDTGDEEPRPFDPAKSLVFPLFETARADGQDVVTILVHWADSDGQPTVRPADVTVELAGLEHLNSEPLQWQPVYISIGTYDGFQVRTNTIPGEGSVTVSGMAATVQKVVASPNPPALETTTLQLDADRVLLEPRDSDGHLVGSGLAFDVVSEPPTDAVFEYREFGQYVLPASLEWVRVNVDNRFEVATPNAPAAPSETGGSCGGCAVEPRSKRSQGMFLLLLAVALGMARMRNRRSPLS